MRNFTRSFASFYAFVAVLLASSAMAANNPTEKTLRNVYDLPIVDVAGERINYTQQDLQGHAPAQKTAFQAGLAGSGQAPRGISDSIPEFGNTWSYAFLGSGLGLSMWAGQSDVGQPEIYAGSGGAGFGQNTFWVAFQYNADKQNYQAVFSSEAYGSPLMNLAVADILGDVKKEIIAATEDGQLIVYDQASKTVIKRGQVPGPITAMCAANTDGVGKDELIISTAASVSVFSDSQLLWSVPGASGRDIVLAQMDDDPAMEIALTGGYVVDCATHTIQWTYATGFGNNLAATDFDGDGKAELIAAESWYYVWAYDVDTQFPKWSHQTDLDVDAVAVTDVDGDGTVEIAIGDGQWGNVYAIDPTTLAVKYSIHNPEHGVTNIATADVDSDGKTEIIWAAGYTSSGEDFLFVADPLTATIEWTSIDLDGPVVGPEIGDLDGDGHLELVIASSDADSGYSSGRILVFDNETLELRAISGSTFNNRAWEGLNDLKLRDVDGDGKAEIILAADDLYDGVVEIYKFNNNDTFTMAWTNLTQPEGEPFSAVEVADVDEDGNLEILAGNARVHTGSAGTFLRLLDYDTKATEWTSFHLAPGTSWNNIADVAAADVNTSAGLEMLALVNGGSVYVFDGKTREPRAIINGFFNHMRLDGKDIYLSTTSGAIKQFRYDGNNYVEVGSTQVATGLIDGFNIIDGPAGGFTFGQDGRLNIFAAGKIQARSMDYGKPYGGTFVGGATGGSYCLTVNRTNATPLLLAEPPVTKGTWNIVLWDFLPGALSYTIQMASDPDFENILDTRVEYGLMHKYTELQTGQNYYFRVKAKYLDGETESAWSATESTFQEPAPASAADWQLFL